MSNRIQGRVKWFDDKKGFGFILHLEGDVFAHFSAVICEGYKTLEEASEVEYELTKGDKGLAARAIKPLILYKCDSCGKYFDARGSRVCPNCRAENVR